MTRIYSPTRMLIALVCIAMSLFSKPITTLRPSTSMMLKDNISFHTCSLLAAITFVALLPQNANAYAIREVAHLAPYPNEKRDADRLERRHEESSWNPDCTDESTVPVTVAGHSSLEPVTVTVTVGLPNSTYATVYTTTKDSAYGSSMSGTVANGSNSVSATRTSSSAASTPTVDPLLASAQEAQQLNLAFQSLRTNDPCSPGERACISNQLAQCSTPASSSETPTWVTQACVIGSDPNQVPICAATPYSSSSSSSTSMPYTVANASVPVNLGCFAPDALTQLFDRAGVQGGRLPPGTTQTSAARSLGASGELTGLGLLALIALSLF